MHRTKKVAGVWERLIDGQVAMFMATEQPVCGKKDPVFLLPIHVV